MGKVHKLAVDLSRTARVRMAWRIAAQIAWRAADRRGLTKDS